MSGPRKSMRTLTLGYGPDPVQYGTWIMSRYWPFAIGTPFCSSWRKWIWCMWNSWFSPVRFWIVQSSTEPWVVTIAGGLVGANRGGVAPSTVMKKFVGLSGLFGSERTSEK